MRKLDIRTFALTAGIFWAAAVFATGLMVTFFVGMTLEIGFPNA